MGSHRDRDVAWSASDRQCLNVESCVWKAVLLMQFTLYVHKGGLKPRSLGLNILIWRKFIRARTTVVVFSNKPTALLQCTPFIPVNIKHVYNTCTMLNQRRNCWADVVQMLYKCFVFWWDVVFSPSALISDFAASSSREVQKVSTMCII